MTKQPSLLDDNGALLDPSGAYRYRLWRRWNPALGDVVWIMLNPSTADAVEDDPTVQRCVGYARAWGYGGIVIVNLFALRSPYPRRLYEHPDPVGHDNDAHIRAAVSEAARVIAAWSAHGTYRARGAAVARLVREAGKHLECLGITKNGQPKHPGRLSRQLRPVPYEPLRDDHPTQDSVSKV